MYDWIRRNGYDPIIIATKLDKINRSQIQKQIKLIRTTLQAGALTRPDPSVATRHLPTLWGVTLTEGVSKHPTT